MNDYDKLYDACEEAGLTMTISKIGKGSKTRMVLNVFKGKKRLEFEQNTPTEPFDATAKRLRKQVQKELD